jgi:membrane-bound metal-dependent hydrolase YbcI (DUF457 family)
VDLNNKGKIAEVSSMPVLGHAFIGLAVGVYTKPSQKPLLSQSMLIGSTFWIPIAVGLSYLPDIVAQIAFLAGSTHARVITHSILFAIIASAVIGSGLSLIIDFSYLRLFFISLISTLIHDLLDLVQATDRIPFWPFSNHTVSFNLNLLPTNPYRELICFGLFLLFFLILYRILSPFKTQKEIINPGQKRSPLWAIRASRILITTIILVAAITHYLREIREQELEKARILLEQQSYRDTLNTLDLAGQWPSTAKPGRIDYLRAEAFQGMGDRRHAEEYYLRAYRIDPWYFWVVADLAIFYASSDLPIEERRRQTMPYLFRLKNDFASHKDFQTVLLRIERKLVTTTRSGNSRP